MLTLILIHLYKKVIHYLKTKQGRTMLLKKLNRFHSRFLAMLLLAGFILIGKKTGAQQLNYDVMKGDQCIGKIYLAIEHKNEKVNYRFNSDVKVSFILSFDVSTQIFVSFESNLMIQSKMVRKVNGRDKVNNLTEWNGKYYVLKKAGENNTTINTGITYCTTSLFNTEPQNTNSVYSECLQQLVPLRVLENHCYMIELPGGNRSFYYYTKGICTLLEAYTGLAVVKFKLDKASMVANNLIEK